MVDGTDDASSEPKSRCSEDVHTRPFDDEWKSPFTRHWIKRDEDDAGSEEENLDDVSKFRVLSFNILAEGLAKGWPPRDAVDSHKPDTAEKLDSNQACKAPADCLYSVRNEGGIKRVQAPLGVLYAEDMDADTAPLFTFRCPHADLGWDHRWPKLRSLIREHSPDLIGLQELDLPKDSPKQSRVFRDLERFGYTGCGGKKKGRAVDGVGLLWNSRFKALGDPEILKLIGAGVHVALLQRLLVDDRYEIIAVATHFKAGLTVESEEARLEQAKTLFKRVRKYQLPVVVLADLNCCSANIIGSEGQEMEPKVLPYFRAKGFRDTNEEVEGREPPFTFWGGWAGHDTAGSFDHILCFGRGLKAEAVLAMPEAEEVLSFPHRLPNPHFPSDHFPLVADVQLRHSKQPERPSKDPEFDEDGFQIYKGKRGSR